MRFVRRDAAGSRNAPPVTASGRPRWLREWIADKGVFVKLACGCIDDLNPRLVPLVRSMMNGSLEVYCDKHEGFYPVVHKSCASELAGIAAARIPDEPLF